MLLPKIVIGTSGWNYRHWRAGFYHKTPQKMWLGYYATKFNSVEINATFYRLQNPETFRNWAANTSVQFRFSLKANRFLTHNKRLLDPETSVKIEQQHASKLEKKLLAVLWQLHPGFVHSQRHFLRLHTFLKTLAGWNEALHVIEFRHDSWFVESVRCLMENYGVGIFQSDSANWPLWPAISSDVVYVRLHGNIQTYVSAYTNSQITQWANKICVWQTQGKRFLVYFDNDAEGGSSGKCATVTEDCKLLKNRKKQINRITEG